MPAFTKELHDSHGNIREYTQLLRHAARELPDLSPRERLELRDRVLTYLRVVVEPHTRRDDSVHYPEITPRLGDRLATDSLNYDHLAIGHWIKQIAEAHLNRPEPLQELLYGLDALLRVHLWKENELYLATLDSSPWPLSA